MGLAAGSGHGSNDNPADAAEAADAGLQVFHQGLDAQKGVVPDRLAKEGGTLVRDGRAVPEVRFRGELPSVCQIAIPLRVLGEKQVSVLWRSFAGGEDIFNPDVRHPFPE